MSLGPFTTPEPDPGTPKWLSPGPPSIAPNTCRLNALGISNLSRKLLFSPMAVRLMMEKSSFLYPGLRHQPTTAGRFPKTYPPPAASEAALGSRNALQFAGPGVVPFGWKTPTCSKQPLFQPPTNCTVPFTSAILFPPLAVTSCDGVHRPGPNGDTPGILLNR